MTDCATIDPFSNRYYAVRFLGSLGIHDLLEHRLNTGTLVFHALPSPSIGFLKFFQNVAAHTSVENAAAADEPFTIFPNPIVANTLHVRLAKGIVSAKAALLEIHDLRGAAVVRLIALSRDNAIDLSGLSAGSYMVS